MLARTLIAAFFMATATGLSAEVGYRNSLGADTSLAGLDVSLSSVQTMEEIGGELSSYSLSLAVTKRLENGHRVLADAARYQSRSGNSWTTYSRYRLGWGYGWQAGVINWSSVVRLEHRDVSDNQHDRLELSLQASRTSENWRPYLSAQLRYHLDDSYLLTRRINLGTSYSLDERWTLGSFLRYQQSARNGDWQDPELILGTSLNYGF